MTMNIPLKSARPLKQRVKNVVCGTLRGSTIPRIAITGIAITGIIISGLSVNAWGQSSETAYKPIIEQVIKKAILPSYEKLVEEAAHQESNIEKLCLSPSETNLNSAKDSFRSLVSAWSRVEMYRIGPAIKDNRQEKLFFWPDRKSIGLRQVRKLIDTEEQTALTTETLKKKSVAVQGILALEYVLFGKNSETLSVATPKSYRCEYGATIAQAIGVTAQTIVDDWSSPSGYAAQMLDTSSTNPIYRSDAEVMQDLLRISSEMIQSTRDLKIKNTIKDSPEKSKPKRAPFWRSNLTLHAYRNNLDAVVSLFTIGGLGQLTPRYTKSLAFELEQTNKFLAELEKENTSWEKQVKQKEAHELLTFTLIPLEGAQYIVSDLIPQELGLSLGFNSLDGD
ncbi:imelysin family protein [Kiloniella spongiae]|uniref:imelysin family protein n=1 Tax=Kiloniella spongiae TaxID=1489064 RepID=UPI000699B1E6|nr:imelysin family protein [Kiloniella spongiae]